VRKSPIREVSQHKKKGNYPLFNQLLIIVNTIAYGSILSMDNHISLVFSSQAFCFSNGRILASVFRGDTFIPLTPYGPTVFIRYNVLVPGPSSFALTSTFKKDLYKFTQNVYPGSGFVAFRHFAFFRYYRRYYFQLRIYGTLFLDTTIAVLKPHLHFITDGQALLRWVNWVSSLSSWTIGNRRNRISTLQECTFY